jgi:hypothetical protein
MTYEAEVLISSMRSGIGITLPKTKMTMIAQPVKLHKSSKLLKCPVRMKKETRAFITMVKVNTQEAVVLLDLGCMMDTLSPELVRVTGIKVYELTGQVPVQLGTRGSQLKISYSIKTAIKYGLIDMDHYFDVVNINRYDVILGMVFMRRHGIALDFGMNQVWKGDWVIPALKEGEDEYLQVHRQAMQFWEETDKQEGMSGTNSHWLENGMNTAPWVKKPPDKETGKRMLSSKARRASISEEDNVDMHWPGMGLPIAFPVLMEEEDDIAIDNIEQMIEDAPDVIKSGWDLRQIRKELEELDKIVQEVSRVSYPKKYARNNRPHTTYQLRQKVDADKMNEVLMVVGHTWPLSHLKWVSVEIDINSHHKDTCARMA